MVIWGVVSKAEEIRVHKSEFCKYGIQGSQELGTGARNHSSLSPPTCLSKKPFLVPNLVSSPLDNWEV